MSAAKIFLLSPANCGGERAKFLLNENAQFDLAQRVRSRAGAPLGEIFAFLSGLYFRGKLAYAQRFSAPPSGAEGCYVITTSRGLVSPQTCVTLQDLRAMGCVSIDPNDLNYREPLERDARAIARACDRCDVILLGSVASGKYVDILLDAFGPRLHFPIDFVGRGDMSRGGLMLRAAESGVELPYVPVSGATRRGKRPPKLERRRALP
jgi:hypothetical protein